MAAVSVLDELELTQAQAKAIVKKAIPYGAYDGDMPKDKKGQIEAATSVVTFCIDAIVNDKIREIDDDEEMQDAAEKVDELLEMAGIEIDDDYEVNFIDDDSDDDEDDEDDEEDEDDSEDDEAPFDPDDYFEDGYTELTPASKVKALKALDNEDEDDLTAIERIKEWEEEQDKPSSRVLSWIDDNFDFEDGDDDAEDEDDDDSDDDAEGEATDEPWDGYDKATAVDIKKALTAKLEDEDDPLTAEQVEYVLEYEKNREKPPPRSRVIKHCEELIEQLEADEDAEDAEDEDEEEEKPAARKLGKKGKGSKAKAAAKEKNKGDGTVSISFNGGDEIVIDGDALLQIFGQFAVELEGGAASIEITTE